MNHRSSVRRSPLRRAGVTAATLLAVAALPVLAACSSNSGVVAPSGSTDTGAPPQQSVTDQSVPADPSLVPGYTGGSLAPTMVGNPKPGNKGAFCKLLTRAQAAKAFGLALTAARPHLAGDNPGGKVLDGCVYSAGNSMMSYDVIEFATVPADALAAAKQRLPQTGAATAFEPKVGDGSVGALLDAPGGGTVIVVAVVGKREVIVTATLKTAAAAKTAAVSTATTLLKA